MTGEGRYFALTVVAGADFTSAHLHKAVNIAGTVAAAGITAIGLLKSKPNTGEHAQVGYFGVMKAVSGGAINSGTALQIANSGFIVAYVSAISSIQVASGTFLPGADLPIGRTLEQVASGDLFKGVFNFINHAQI